MARKFQNELPQALRECGLLAARKRRAAAAQRMFLESLEIANSQDALYERVLTLQAYGKCGQQFGWHDADAKLVEATTMLADSKPLGWPAEGEDLMSIPPQGVLMRK